MICDAGICQPDWRPGYECRNNADCAGGATCVDGMCTVECWSDSECRTGTCDAGYCTR
jgi:Cys-rich repeat protein